jgi:hypothetical protein
LKTRIAAAATILGLGGLAGLALSAGGQKASSLASKPLVRTKVIHRTVHVTKHVKPKHPVAGGPAGYSGAVPSGSAGAPVVTGASSSGAAESTPVVTGASSSGSAESAPVVTGSSGTGGGSAPVVTSASGGGGGAGGEAEHEGGDGGGD